METDTATTEGMNILIGQAAGIVTSMFWVATSIFFTSAGRRIGPTNVNTIRIFMAIALLGITHLLRTGAWFSEIPGTQIGYLAASGIIGLAIGDQALFTSFVYIGPRLALLVMSTSPLLAVLFGWVVLDESLSGFAILGIVMTIGGVGWVVFERRLPVDHSAQPVGTIDESNKASIKASISPPHYQPRWYVWGITLATIGSLCQAGGLLLSKQGMGHGVGDDAQMITPQAATLVRMIFAAVGVLPIYAIQWWRAHRSGVGMDAHVRAHRQWGVGLTLTFAGAIVGPYLGVWLSLVAADLIPIGIAQTLCSLSPVLVLPVVAVVYREKVSPRAVYGALLAVAGVSVLVFNTTG